MLEREENIAISVIQTLSKWEYSDLLIEIIKDRNKSPYLRREAIKQLQYFASKKCIYPILKLSHENYYFYGETCIESLKILNRRGISCDKKETEYILKIFLNNHKIDIDTIANLLKNSNNNYLEKIFEIPLTNSFWNRIITLLEKINTKESKSILLLLIKNNESKHLWKDVINSIKNIECYEAEIEIHKIFDDEPFASIDALKYIGTNKTVTFLRNKLRLNDLNKINFFAWESQAIKLLLQLTNNQFEVIEYLKKYNILVDEKTLNLLFIESDIKMLDFLSVQTKEKNDNLLGYKAIKMLGELGDEKTIEFLGKLLFDSNEEIQNLVKNSIKEIAHRLYKNERIKPKHLLSSSEEQASNYLLSKVLIKQLENENINDAEVQFLLSELSGISYSNIKDRILYLLKHNNPHIKKFVIECLGNSNNPNVSSELINFVTSSKDIYTLRQAIIAFTKINAFWIVNEIIVHLKHKNMNIKKTVAEFLVNVGDIKSVKPIIQELKVNENVGLRELLKKSLKNILGDRYTLTLVSELPFCNSVREQNLIINAFLDEISQISVFKIVQEKIKGYDNILHGFDEISSNKFNSTLKNFDKTTIHVDIKEYLNKIESYYELEKKDLDYLGKIVKYLPQYAKFFVIKILKSQLKRSKKNFDQLFQILKTYKAVLSTSEARLAFLCKDDDVRIWALNFILLEENASETEINNLLLYLKDSSIENIIFDYLLKRGKYSDLFEYYYNDENFRYFSKELEKNFSISFLINKFNEKVSYGKLNNSDIEKIKRLLEWILSFSNSNVDELIFSLLNNNNEQLLQLVLEKINKEISISYQEEINNLLNARSKEVRELAISKLIKNPLTEFTRKNLIQNYINVNLNKDFNYFTVSYNEFCELKEQYQNLINIVKNKEYFNLNEEYKGIINRITLLLFNAKCYPDEFIYLLLYVYQSESEKQIFRVNLILEKIPVEKLWNYIKEEIYNKNWKLLSLINDNQPINSELLILLMELPINEKVFILSFLINLSKRHSLNFPEISNELLIYCETWEDIELPYNLLFSLKDWEIQGHEILTQKLLNLFKDANNQRKEKLLAIYFNKAPNSFIQNNEFLENIANYCNTPKHFETAFKIIFKGANWKNVEIVNQNMEILEKNYFHRNKNSTELFSYFLNGIKIHSNINQIFWLSNLYKYNSSKLQIIDRSIEMYLKESDIINFLPDNILIDFQERIVKQITNKEYSVENFDLHKVLTNLSEMPFSSFLILLERIALLDNHSNNRSLAHRLLKKCVSKEKYLEITQKLLEDKVAEIKQHSIKVLSFSKYIPATNEIIKLLYHKKETVRKTAYEGLKLMGREILPILEKEIKHQRPDKRSIIDEIITNIRNNC